MTLQMSDALEFLSNPTSCIHILEKISTREILNDSALDAQAKLPAVIRMVHPYHSLTYWNDIYSIDVSRRTKLGSVHLY